jgi:uncharacterized protein (DUF433 family)
MNPIAVDPEIMGGTPCFAGTRVPMKTLFDLLEKGRSLDHFVEHFPTVEPAQAVAVLHLAKQHVLSPASVPAV